MNMQLGLPTPQHAGRGVRRVPLDVFAGDLRDARASTRTSCPGAFPPPAQKESPVPISGIAVYASSA